MEFQPLKYIFKPFGIPETNALLLFHGTGDDEEDLFDIASYLARDANFLSLTGNVLKNCIPRFFQRLAPRKFDEQDLAFRSDEVLAFIRQVATREGFKINNIIAFGYSNGTNILGPTILRHPDFLQGVILLRPMKQPYRVLSEVSMEQLCPVFMSSGASDSTVEPAVIESYYKALTERGLAVTWHLKKGHGLSADDFNRAAQWYYRYFG